MKIVANFDSYAARLQIFVAGARGANAAPQDVDCPLQTWGVGANIQTKLINPAGEVRLNCLSYAEKTRVTFTQKYNINAVIKIIIIIIIIIITTIRVIIIILIISLKK